MPQPHRPGRHLLLAILLLLCAPSAHAATTLTPGVLAARGIDMQMFSMVTFSWDGSVLVGVERVKDLKLKQRGIGHLLRVLRWRGGRLAGLDTIPLPTTGFEQLGLSADGSHALVIGEGGSKFLWVDIRTRSVRVLWTHHRGTPGFRSELVVWWANEAFYLLGYLHDSADNLTYNGLIRLNTASSGSDMFQPRLNVRSLQRELGAFLFEMYIDETQAFLGVTRRPDLVDVYCYQNGRLTKLDQVMAVGGIASARNRIMYAARFGGDRRDVLLRDVVSNKVWHLGKSNLPYNYLFLSADGRTAVLTLMDFRGNQMSYFYGREGDGFKVHPVLPLQNVRPGTLRLAGSGRAFAYYGPGGLTYGSLP